MFIDLTMPCRSKPTISRTQRRNPPTPSRAWCFTLCNPSDTQLSNLNWYSLGDLISYAVWQLEQGALHGTPHLQGYVETTRLCRFSAFRSILNGAHFEQRMGTREEAREYCMKQDTRVAGPWEYGTWKGSNPGKRTDLQTVVDMINAGKTLSDIQDACPVQYIKFHRGIEKLLAAKTKVKRDWKTKSYLFIGPTGTGKTTLARQLAPDAYIKDPRNKWYDGYDNHDAIHLDDFYGTIDYDHILRLQDSLPITGETKGGTVPLVPKTTIITSNQMPGEWPGWKGLDLEPFKRRLVEAKIIDYDHIHTLDTKSIKNGGVSWNSMTLDQIMHVISDPFHKHQYILCTEPNTIINNNTENQINIINNINITISPRSTNK